MEKLRSEKSKLLEEVMEKETYKVAKEILDKYGMSEQLRKPPSKVPSTGPQLNKSNSVGGGAATTPIDAGGVRRRPVGSAAGSTTRYGHKCIFILIKRKYLKPARMTYH